MAYQYHDCQQQVSIEGIVYIEILPNNYYTNVSFMTNDGGNLYINICFQKIWDMNQIDFGELQFYINFVFV